MGTEREQSPRVSTLLTKRRPIALAALAASLWALTAGADAQQIYRCVVKGKTLYQQEPCEKTGGTGKEINVEPAVVSSSPAKPSSTPAAVPAPAAPAASAPAPAPAQPAAPAKSELDTQADACLDWYRPLLRDPRGAYHRDARMEKGVLTFTIFATNDRGGYEQKAAACEFKSGRLDEAWTKTLSRRHGW